MADSAILVQVANAVTQQLTSAPPLTFSESFTPQRSYADWDLPLEQISDELLCDVVPVNNPKSELEERGAVQYLAQVDIVLRRRFKLADQDTGTGRVPLALVDALVKVVEELHEFFCGERMTAFSPEEADRMGTWESTEVLAAYRKDHLRQHRQFTGIVRVTFRVVKPT
jgi:hypothetical protein